MVRIRSMFAAVALLAASGASTASAADYLFDWGSDFDPSYQSAYLQWMAGTELAGRAAPLAITNQPCYYYDGPRLIVHPCPGAFVAEGGGWVRARY